MDVKHTEIVIQVQDITLDETEEFVVPYPHYHYRKLLVNWIRVHETYFEVLGQPFYGSRPGKVRHRHGAHIRMDHGFRSTDEVPSMPRFVADAINEFLHQDEWLKELR